MYSLILYHSRSFTLPYILAWPWSLQEIWWVSGNSRHIKVIAPCWQKKTFRRPEKCYYKIPISKQGNWSSFSLKPNYPEQDFYRELARFKFKLPMPVLRNYYKMVRKYKKKVIFQSFTNSSFIFLNKPAFCGFWGSC